MTHKTNRDSIRAYKAKLRELRDNQQAEIAAGIDAEANDLAKEVSWWRR